MTDQITDLQLIEKYYEIDTHVSAETTRFNESIKPYKDNMDTLKNELQRRLNERGANNTKTEAGTAFKSRFLDITIVDRSKFLAFCLDNWKTFGADMLNISAVTGPVKDFIDESETKAPPPGLNIVGRVRMSIRRA